MKKLYKVSVEVVGYVLAKDERDACTFVGDVVDNVPVSDIAVAEEVLPGDVIDENWDAECLVFGVKGDIKIKDVWPK